jgi:hypothetical protein
MRPRSALMCSFTPQVQVGNTLVGGEHHSDHGSASTSTDSAADRWETMEFQGAVFQKPKRFL